MSWDEYLDGVPPLTPEVRQTIDAWQYQENKALDEFRLSAAMARRAYMARYDQEDEMDEALSEIYAVRYLLHLALVAPSRTLAKACIRRMKNHHSLFTCLWREKGQDLLLLLLQHTASFTIARWAIERLENEDWLYVLTMCACDGKLIQSLPFARQELNEDGVYEPVNIICLQNTACRKLWELNIQKLEDAVYGAPEPEIRFEAEYLAAMHSNNEYLLYCIAMHGTDDENRTAAASNLIGSQNLDMLRDLALNADLARVRRCGINEKMDSPTLLAYILRGRENEMLTSCSAVQILIDRNDLDACDALLQLAQSNTGLYDLGAEICQGLIIFMAAFLTPAIAGYLAYKDDPRALTLFSEFVGTSDWQDFTSKPRHWLGFLLWLRCLTGKNAAVRPFFVQCMRYIAEALPDNLPLREMLYANIEKYRD